MIRIKIIFLFLLSLVAVSCKKYKDNPAQPDPRLTRPYCNDPQAVNYNWDFPGVPDNSKCFYPSDVFTGNYLYTDSVYNGTSNLLNVQSYNLTISKTSNTKLQLGGLCPSGSLSFTANRFARADGDTSVPGGQPLCRPQDVISGNITCPDRASGFLLFDLTVAGDTGTFFHRGSAVKQ